MEIFYAITLGLLFGFALNRAGATNPQNIINMLRLTDTFLMKAILLAIGISAIGLFGSLALGLIDPSHVSIKSAYIGVIVGGALLGIGFALAGYCPGTGLAAMATGRKDAIAFVIGGFVGAFIYMLGFGWLENNTPLFQEISGGDVSLALTGNDKYDAILPQLGGPFLGIIIGIAFCLIAIALPKNILKG
ncbi:MAG: DUF6691 family protein, partial [Alphaproteobacteria bacterium]